MKQINKEHGYALITVLLVVILFMALSLAFFTQVFSTTKQNQVVDKMTRSVSAAEMGVSFYQVEIQHKYEQLQNTVNSHVSTIMSQPDASKTKDFKREATIKMAQELQKVTLSGTMSNPIKIEEHPNASFYIKDFVVASEPTSTSYKINISFNVIGNQDGKETKLFAKMNLDLNTINNIPTNKPEDYILPSYTNIIKPTINICSDNTKLEDKKDDCNTYINGNASFDGNNLISSNKTIYTTGTLTLTGQGNENNNSNIHIHAEKGITIGKNMNSQTGMVIETNEDATFNQNLKIDTLSQLLVRRNLRVDQQLDVSKNSFVYVGEDATVRFLNISSVSKMCVHGNLMYANSPTVTTINNEEKSNLKVLGEVRKILEYNADGTVKRFEVVQNSSYKVDENTFKTECGTYVPPAFQINWGNAVTPIINDVEY